jgi:hypothetical protein
MKKKYNGGDLFPFTLQVRELPVMRCLDGIQSCLKQGTNWQVKQSAAMRM